MKQKKTTRGKRILSACLAVLLLAAFLPPMEAHAGSNPSAYTFDISDGDITIIKGPTSNTLKVTYGPSQTTTADFSATQEITIIGTSNSNSVHVGGADNSDFSAKVTLENVNINSREAFGIGAGTTVHLMLSGSNKLKSDNFAGIQMYASATVIIDAKTGLTDTLTATSSYNGAGIGSNTGTGGTVTINGGTVTATGADHGAGIGGGYGGAGGTVTITGGTVIAKGGFGGAGIGGGNGGNGGTVTITGGTVKAQSRDGMDVGYGSSGTGEGSLKITGGSVWAVADKVPADTTSDGSTSVFCKELTLDSPSVNDEVAVTATNISGYGYKDVATQNGGKLYFWLPETNSETETNVTVNGVAYKNSWTRATAREQITLFHNAATPQITEQPADKRWTYGESRQALSVTATSPDGGALSYQWYSCNDKNKANPQKIQGESNTTCTPAVTDAGTYYYYVAVTNTKSSAFGSQTATTDSDVVAVTIDKKTITITPNAGQSKTYGQSDPEFTFSNDGALDIGDFTGALGRVAGENVGNYAIDLGTLAPKSNNYTLSLNTTPVDFNINPNAGAIFSIDPISNQIYTGSAITPLPVVKVDNITLVKDTDYTLSYTDNVNAGIAKVEVEGKGNYAGATAASANFTIDPKPVIITPNAGQSKTYGNPDPDLTFIDDGGLGMGNFTGALSRDAGNDVGSYTISLGTLAPNSSNYTLSLSATTVDFTITPKPVTITPKAGQSKTYGQSDPALTFSNDGALDIGDFTGALERVAGENVGNYEIKMGNLSAGNNYTLSLIATPVDFTIKPNAGATLTIATIADQIYTGSAIEPIPDVRVGDITLVSGTDYTLSYTDNTNVGTATVTVTGIGNYLGAKATQTFKIVTYYAATVKDSYATTTGAGSYLAGETVTLDAGARAGYRFKGWETQDGVALADASSAQTTFTMPTHAVTVTATWRANSISGGPSTPSTPNTYAVTFNTQGGSKVDSIQDITSGKTLAKPTDPTREGYKFLGWYTDADAKTAWDFAADKVTKNLTLYAGWEKTDAADKPNDQDNTQYDNASYISGYADGTFKPDANMTRAEAATLLYNLLADKDAASAKTFTDVSSSDWYADAVSVLAAKGIIGGDPDGTFRPQETITRAEFATMALRYAGVTVGDDSATYGDVPASHWASSTIAAASAKGYIKGYNDGSFQPDGKITRAEVVTVMNRVEGRKTDAETLQGLELPFTDIPTSHWAYNDILAASVSH